MEYQVVRRISEAIFVLYVTASRDCGPNNQAKGVPLVFPMRQT
jgi:hypothetical protein